MQCFHFQKDDEMTNWLWHKYCKIKLFSGAIFHGASKEPEAYLEPSQYLWGSAFAKIVK